MGLCLTEGLSLRQTADTLGIAVSTAFRWRHRLLSPLTQEERPALGGAEKIVELIDTRYPDCHKGERLLDRRPRRRGMHTAFAGQAALSVLLARDREGHTLVEVLGPGPPGVGTLIGVLAPSLVEGSVVCTKGRPWYKDLCARLRVTRRRGWEEESPLIDWLRQQPKVKQGLETEAGRMRSLDAVAGLGWRLRAWLATFRGVASKYLPNYLAWFRFRERVARLSAREAGHRLLACAGAA